jgi:hypothetical protein
VTKHEKDFSLVEPFRFLLWQRRITMDCNKVEQLTVGSTSIWQIEGQTAFFYKAGMAIDADGCPKAYHPEPDSNLGLDFLANAGSPGNWFGIVTDNGQPDGNPIIQGSDDPAPGFYISSTSLQDKTKDRTDPLRYVDSTQIPYIVLPSVARSNLGAQLGDFAIVINSTNSQISGAIFADVGPRGKIGEGSIALANNLGIPSSPKHGGIDSDVIYVVFPSSGNGNPRSVDKITNEADSLFQAMGGMTQIQACFPELAPLPTVTGISPVSGSAVGGDTVVITGSGFTGATDVGFGATNVASLSVDNDNQITVVSPAGSGTVDVTVITPNGTSAITSADQFTYT